MMEDSFEIFDKLLHHGLLHHPVIILGILADHDRSFTIGTKGGQQTSLQSRPDLVWQEEYRSLG